MILIALRFRLASTTLVPLESSGDASTMSRTSTHLSLVSPYSHPENTSIGSCTVTELWDYPADNIMILRDDSEDPDLQPTKANIVGLHIGIINCGPNPDRPRCLVVRDGVACR
jgi:hypothetical protein